MTPCRWPVGHYEVNTLNDFNKMFRYSELQGQIDDADDAILNSGSKVYLSKTFTPQLLTSQSHDLFFNNPFFH